MQPILCPDVGSPGVHVQEVHEQRVWSTHRSRRHRWRVLNLIHRCDLGRKVLCRQQGGVQSECQYRIPPRVTVQPSLAGLDRQRDVPTHADHLPLGVPEPQRRLGCALLVCA